MMMKNPNVSVIIPNYNHAQFLDARIQSVLNQTYQDFEIIILDDNSTDNSVEIIKRYENNSHVSHIIINEKNTGNPFKQWSKGFDLAKGNLIWIAESDDLCEKTMLSTLVSAYNENANCVLSFCKSVRINENNEKTGEFSLQCGYTSFCYDFEKFMHKHLSMCNFIINASSVLFRKTALKNVDDKYMNFHGCGDWAFWAEISKSGKTTYVNKELNYYRIHNNNTTSTLARSGIGAIETYNIFEYFYKKKYISKYLFIRRKLSLLMEIRYRRGFPEEIVDKIESDCGYDGFYKVIASVFHFLGRK
jgi:glycosyltransferase involved in cell wall biosynthesis